MLRMERKPVGPQVETDSTKRREESDINTLAEWGDLCEEFSVRLHGRLTRVKVYCKPHDKEWNLYTAVDVATGGILKQEYCPV